MVFYISEITLNKKKTNKQKQKQKQKQKNKQQNKKRRGHLLLFCV